MYVVVTWIPDILQHLDGTLFFDDLQDNFELDTPCRCVTRILVTPKGVLKDSKRKCKLKPGLTNKMVKWLLKHAGQFERIVLDWDFTVTRCNDGNATFEEAVGSPKRRKLLARFFKAHKDKILILTARSTSKQLKQTLKKIDKDITLQVNAREDRKYKSKMEHLRNSKACASCRKYVGVLDNDAKSPDEDSTDEDDEDYMLGDDEILDDEYDEDDEDLLDEGELSDDEDPIEV
jgi:hypothetical protein